MAGKFLKYLPKSTSFSIPSNNININKAVFSGPIVSIIPQEARRNGEAFRAHEPTSPKVSCIGQVKHKKNKKNVEKKTKQQQSLDGREESRKSKSKSKAPSVIRKIFLRNKVKEEEVVMVTVAEIGMMRKYRSGREMLGDFDWRKVGEEVLVAHSAPLVMGGGVVEVEKRKEVNLWKKRTLAPPDPLHIK